MVGPAACPPEEEESRLPVGERRSAPDPLTDAVLAEASGDLDSQGGRGVSSPLRSRSTTTPSASSDALRLPVPTALPPERRRSGRLARSGRRPRRRRTRSRRRLRRRAGGRGRRRGGGGRRCGAWVFLKSRCKSRDRPQGSQFRRASHSRRVPVVDRLAGKRRRPVQ